MQPGIVNHWYFKLRFYFTDIMVWNITAVYDIGFQSYRDYIYKMKVCDKAFHCKLTRRRRSYSIVITFTTLWLRCSSSSYFIHMWRKDNLFGYILWNQNIFDLLNSFLINVHFTIVWRASFLLNNALYSTDVHVFICTILDLNISY